MNNTPSKKINRRFTHNERLDTDRVAMQYNKEMQTRAKNRKKRKKKSR